MTEERVAKLFKIGASQAVRLPPDIRFEGDKVYITRDDSSGDAVLSSIPVARNWREFFEFVHAIDVPAASWLSGR